MIRKLTLLTLPLIALLTSGVYLFLSKSGRMEPPTISSTLFSSTYPVHSRFVAETSQMRSSNKISWENENLIQVATFNAGRTLGIPQALLWCLMFQESRLNHLSGLREGKLSTGLGQFSVSAFFEVNHHLPRYLPSPKSTLSTILGYDIRPLNANFQDTSAINSYYFIPTAVTATALYLNNRFVQLARIADERNLVYSPDILWVWAALSYNKGGRTVLSLWNELEKKAGSAELERALTSKKALLAHALNTKLVNQALRSIWSQHLLANYSNELITHVENIRDCALAPSLTTFNREESL